MPSTNEKEKETTTAHTTNEYVRERTRRAFFARGMGEGLKRGWQLVSKTVV